MTGLIVAWEEEELQAIDQDNFESMVVEVVDDFFMSVEGPRSVDVIWETATRSHGSRYAVTDEPQLAMDSVRFEIIGASNEGEYRVELVPDELSIRQHSNDWVEELTYLELKAPGVGVNNEEKEIFLPNIPERIKKRLVKKIPKIRS